MSIHVVVSPTTYADHSKLQSELKQLLEPKDSVEEVNTIRTSFVSSLVHGESIKLGLEVSNEATIEDLCESIEQYDPDRIRSVSYDIIAEA